MIAVLYRLLQNDFPLQCGKKSVPLFSSGYIRWVDGLVEQKPRNQSIAPVCQEGGLAPWATPRRRPILRLIASFTCVAFSLTQTPVLPLAFAQVQEHLTGIENMRSNLSNWANVETHNRRMQNLMKELENRQKVQNQTLEMSFLTSAARLSYGVQNSYQEIAYGGQAIEQAGNRGGDQIKNLASMVGYNQMPNGLVKFGAIEFNYSIEKQDDKLYPVKTIFTQDGKASRIMNERITTPGGPVYRNTFNMQYKNGLMVGYQAREWRPMGDMPGSILPIRDITWNAEWMPGSL